MTQVSSLGDWVVVITLAETESKGQAVLKGRQCV